MPSSNINNWFTKTSSLNNSTGSIVVSPSTNTTYTLVSVTDGNGCTTTSDPAIINNATPLFISLDIIHPSCFGYNDGEITADELVNGFQSEGFELSLEEANNKTFFFIINNNSYKILNTIKSRCIEFKFFFTLSEKKKILNNIIRKYMDDFDLTKIDECFYFASPGNILKYLLILNIRNIDLLKDKLSCILYLIESYKRKNDPQLLTFVSLLIELFYNELSVKNNNKLNLYFLNKFKLMKQIYDAKKFNLDKKNLFISILGTLENES